MEGKRYINLLETSIKTEKAIVKEKNELCTELREQDKAAAR